jgi:RHS repeat-associated protein
VKYTAHWDNAEVGLVYLGARYYSPQLGRFISPDPLTIHGLMGDSNPYAYADGNPIRFVDPTGLDGEDDSGANTPVGSQNNGIGQVHPSWCCSDCDCVTVHGQKPDRLTLDEIEVIAGPNGVPPPPPGWVAHSPHGDGTYRGWYSHQQSVRDDVRKELESAREEAADRMACFGTCGEQLGPPGKELLFVVATERLLVPRAPRPLEPVPEPAPYRGPRSSPIVEGGGLQAHENAGGHLLERHIGRTAAQLDARLAAEVKLKSASSFVDRAEAEAAASIVLRENAAKISEWVEQGMPNKLVITGDFSGGIIRVVGGYEAEANGALLVLKPNAGGGGYYILTGYPTP